MSNENMNHQIRSDTFLRAVAILSVIGIHLLSSFKQSPYLATSSNQLVAVGLDQIFRFGVPLFVALSGYGLSQKFAKAPLNVKKFWHSRFKKLLPGYLVWSVICIILFVVVPWWHSSQEQANVFLQLIFGKADYHLYFVPMILQLYVLFPIIFWLFKKQPSLTLALAFIVQIIWYWQFSYKANAPVDLQVFANDREQYVWATNWSGYFVLGMYLPKIHEFINKHKSVILMMVAAILGIWLFTLNSAILAINIQKIDPLIALRFTRYPVVIFASLAIIVATWWAKKVRFVPLPLWWLGQKSYHIYLIHTLLLRLFF
jgi:peptidoglycan/LPS O-acetylase OafA/YrhL